MLMHALKIIIKSEDKKMTKKQIKLIKDLILFSKPDKEYAEGYRYVAKELLKEINPATKILKKSVKIMKNLEK